MAWENDPWYREASFETRQVRQFGPLQWTEGEVGPRLAWGLQDDAEALVYYGSFGLLDPKMPFEAYALRSTLGLSGLTGLAIGAGISMTGGVAAASVVGWAFDPMHRREGGIDDWHFDVQAWDFSKGPAW